MDANTINAEKTMRGGVPGTLGHIDQYEIVRELGEGGFGAVYLAKDSVAGVEVAIKGLPPEVKHNRAELENVKANFALVSRLHHPYIAAALHLHLAKTTTYENTAVRDRLRILPGDTMLVMEYAPGVTLDRWRKQFPRGIVPLELAANIGWQVAQALDFAHENRILHRDVKPANVMIETLANGSVTARLLDFGLAAEIRSSMGRVSREIRDTSGTRPYMAPEQWAGRKQTAATDQYALAAMLYELVVGEVPFASVFETGDPVVMMTVVTNRPVEIPAESPRRRALAKALSKEGTDRYPSCMEFVQAFAKSERPEAPKPAAPRSVRPVQQVAPIHRKFGGWRLVAAAVGVLLAAVGAFGYLSVRRDRLELARLSAQIVERRQAFVTEYAKVDAYRSYRQAREARDACISRLDEMSDELEVLAIPRGIVAVRAQLHRMDESLASLRAGLAVLAKDEKDRLEEERAKAAAIKPAVASPESGGAIAAAPPPVAKPTTVVKTPVRELTLHDRMKRMVLPSVAFKSATEMSDVMAFFRQASKDYDAPDLPIEKRGFNLVLDNGMTDGKVPLPTEIGLANISFFDALSTVCDTSGFAFSVENGVVRVRAVRKPDVPTPVQKAKAKAPPTQLDIRAATLAAKRCAQSADWPGCYEQLAQADTNDCEIMYLKGVCLSSMHPDKRAGVKKNDGRAYNWFLRGSKQGDAPCQQNLGEAYRRGVGITRDIDLALYWIKESADKGNPDAVCSLAQMLEKGEGIARDTEKAADLYALAAQKNVAYAVKWVREHHDTDRYKKMVAKRTQTQVAPAEPKPKSTGGLRNFPRPSRLYNRDWSRPRPSIGGGGNGGSNAAVWGSVLGGVLTGLAIGLSAIH